MADNSKPLRVQIVAWPPDLSGQLQALDTFTEATGTCQVTVTTAGLHPGRALLAAYPLAAQGGAAHV